MALFDTWDYEMATDMFCTIIKLDPYEIKSTSRGGLSDKENMQLLVDRCVQIYSKGHRF